MNAYNGNVHDLAETLIDSLATMELPAWGYGLRYKYGNIKQYRQAVKRGDFCSPKRQTGENSKKDFSKNPLEI